MTRQIPGSGGYARRDPVGMVWMGRSESLGAVLVPSVVMKKSLEGNR